MNGDAKRLFLECFDVSEKEAEIIIGYASEHGRIDIFYCENEAANMICTADIGKVKYVFAVCTKPKFRGKGIFRARLEAVIGNDPCVLIPENDSLAAMYEKLGFSPLYVLEAETDGICHSEKFNGTLNELYGIYDKSFQTPKKDIELFKASINAHVTYGGEIRTFGGCAALTIENTVTDIFAPDEKSAIDAAKNALNGKYKSIFPLECEKELIKENIPYIKKRVAMGRNLTDTQIYINTLFN